MDQQIPTDPATAAEPVRAHIAQWRETRTHRGAAMPAAPWAAAVVVARRHGLAPTARVLGVDYATLKRRLAVEGQPATDPGPTFVDLGAAPPLRVGACVIAIDGRRGRRLRLEVSSLCLADLVALVRVAWGRRG